MGNNDGGFHGTAVLATFTGENRVGRHHSNDMTNKCFQMNVSS